MYRDDESASPVAAFLPAVSMVDFPGRMAAVLFTGGCNFRCGFCHNAEALGSFRPGMPWRKLHHQCADFRGQWADGAVITGGEPTLHEDLPRLVKKLKSDGFAVKLDTNGSRPDALERVIEEVDYVAMDIKCAPDRYAELTGFSDVAGLDRSIRLIRDRALDFEFRITLIEPFHDTEQIRAIGEWIRGAKRFILQPFIPRETLPDPILRETPRTRPQRLQECRDLLSPCVAEVLIRGD